RRRTVLAVTTCPWSWRSPGKPGSGSINRDEVFFKAHTHHRATRQAEKTTDPGRSQGPSGVVKEPPSRHLRPGYSFRGCVPAEPRSASPGAWSVAIGQQLLQPISPG